MTIIENTQYVQAIFSNDNTERYRLLRVWNENAPRACVIMIHPVSDNIFSIDLTSCLTLTNLNALGFGSCDTVNICPKILPKNKEIGEIVSETNLEQISESAKSADKIIIAWGTVGSFNRKINDRIIEILRILKPYESKTFTTTDGKTKNVHPLFPSLRSRWMLEKFDFPTLDTKADGAEKTDANSKKKAKKAQNQAENSKQGLDQSQNSVPQEENPPTQESEIVQETDQQVHSHDQTAVGA